MLKKFLLVLFVSLFLCTYGMPIGMASATTIPHIAGTWKLSGVGTLDGNEYTDKGTCTFISYVDTNNEVITVYFYEGEIRDYKGDLLIKDAYAYHVPKPGLIVDGNPKRFEIPGRLNFNLDIMSDKKAVASGTIIVQSNTVTDAVNTLTRDTVPEIVPSGSLPSIAGKWYSSGTGTAGDTPATETGTIDITTEMGTDGYERVTKYASNAEARDNVGNLLYTYNYVLLPDDIGGELIVNRRTFPVIMAKNRFEVTVVSSEKMTASRVGIEEGTFVKGQYNITRTAPTPPPTPDSGGGGGCNVAGFSLLAFLFIPLVLFNRKSR